MKNTRISNKKVPAQIYEYSRNLAEQLKRKENAGSIADIIQRALMSYKKNKVVNYKQLYIELNK